MSEAFLELTGLSKRFDEHQAVADLSLAVPQGTVLALLGPSGSGKTTTLRLLAGFEQPDHGQVIVGGRDVTKLAPAARRFGMVFQHYALFPHLTVGQNVAFGLAGRFSRDERVRRVAEVLGLVDLTGFADRSVGALSGGQQQRVAVARALAPAPEILLLDEPLSNLDPGLRERTRRELKSALAKIGVTTVLVTHEQEEAFALGDRIAVLRDGRLEQFGTARELYEHPKSLFVATFVGRASILPGIMTSDDSARIGAAATWPVETPVTLAEADRVSVVVRPEAVRFDESGLPGTVTARGYVGARAYFTVDVGPGSVEVEASVDAAEVGARVHLDVVHALAFAEEAA
jgi:ABC-type Fe3+/spermidine/putrescine transport system ATPase subunit